MACKYLKELLLEERKIIERHLEEYKDRKEIYDNTEAKINFVKDYGWIIREIFCNLCKENNCEEREILNQRGLYPSNSRT